MSSASAASSALLLSRVLLRHRRLPSSSTDWQASTPFEQACPVSLAVSQRETKAKRLPRSAAEAAERGEACVAGHVLPTEPAAARRNLAAERPRGACLLASLRCVQQVDIQRSMGRFVVSGLVRKAGAAKTCESGERKKTFALVLSKKAGALKTLSLESFFELLREKEKELPSIVLLN